MGNRSDTSLRKQETIGLITHMEELGFKDVRQFHTFSKNKENMEAAAGWFINLMMKRWMYPIWCFNFPSEVWGEVIFGGRKRREKWVCYKGEKYTVRRWTGKFPK